MSVAGENIEHRTTAGENVSRADKRRLQRPGETAPTTWTQGGRDHALSVGRSGVSMLQHIYYDLRPRACRLNYKR